MKIIVVYSSLSGNTKKIAEFISETLECPIVNVNNEDNSDFWKDMKKVLDSSSNNLIILGSGIYAGNVSRDLWTFIKYNTPYTKNIFALFATWRGRGNSGTKGLDRVKDFLQKHSQKVNSKYFLSIGNPTSANMDNPYKEIFENAKEWALSLSKQLKPKKEKLLINVDN